MPPVRGKQPSKIVGPFGGLIYNLAGKKFGRLTVVDISSKSKPKKPRWNCVCECGTKKDVLACSLRIGKTLSCGCLFLEMLSATKTKHGCAGGSIQGAAKPEYTIWMVMKSRCRDKDNPDYGGRGIKVCERWMVFENFLADMGRRPADNSPGRRRSEYTIERIDNDGDYEPGNCRWATQKEQTRNTRSNRRIEFQGTTLTLAEWSERLGIPYFTLHSRFRKGWTVEKAFTKPVGKTSPPIVLTLNGETLGVKAWSKKLGIAVGTIVDRIRSGWSVEKVLSAPVRRRRVA